MVITLQLVVEYLAMEEQLQQLFIGHLVVLAGIRMVQMAQHMDVLLIQLAVKLL